MPTTLAPPIATDAAPAGFDDAWARLCADYRARLRRHGIVGSSLLLLHAGAVRAWETFGLADREAQRPVDRETIFHWASITKVFTGLAVMQLRDRGRLALDDPLVEYVPELRAVHNPYGDVADVTVAHVMSHSAGFRAATWPWGGNRPWHPHEPTAWAQLVAMMPYTEIGFPPGSRYRYSNLGIVFLGRLIETLTGDDYEVYVDKNLLKPLAMHRSYFDHTPYHLLAHRANSYDVRDGVPAANGLDFDTGITAANGGLNAPLGDMARLLAFLTNGADETILGRCSLEEMWAVRHPVAERGPFRESVGLVFHVLERSGFRVVGHTGRQQAFVACFYVDPAARTGVLLVFNTLGVDGSAPDTRALMADLRRQLFEDIFPIFDDGAPAGEVGGAPVPFAPPD